MNNYVDDEINNYIETYNEEPNIKHFNKKYLIIGVIVVIIVLIFVLFITRNRSSVSSYEKNMVSQAKEYVRNNSINANKEIYIDVSKLNIDLGNDCSSLSGVIYDGNNYTPYLLCKNYESEIVNNDVDGEIVTDFKLIGNDVVVLLKGMKYYELGYECSEPVSIISTNISEEGIYNIYYILENSNLIFTRKVIIIDNLELSNMYPAINTSSKNTVTIEKGNQYDDVVTAVDSIDGDLTEKIIRVGEVDVNTVGEYKKIYSVSNSLGYMTSIEKMITVIDSSNEEIEIVTSLSNENITNESINVNVRIIGNGYDYTKLPDGRTTNEKEFEYLIEDSGEYEFIAVSKDEKEINKVLTITNIDKTIPEGTCEATLYNDKTSINVTMKSFNYITGYNYYTDNNSSGYIEYNFYNSNTKNPTNIYVMARDYVGNEGKIICTKTDEQTHFDPQGYRTVLTQPSRLTFAITSALARKGYTLNDLNMCIYNRVKDAGPYTRYGVAAAAFGLIDCSYKMTGYRLPYNHSSGNVDPTCKTNAEICGKLGVASYWGTPGGVCGRNDDGTKKQCWHGLNCATFVRWAMCNGGMDLCTRGSTFAYEMTDIKYFPEADAVYIKGNTVKYVFGVDYSSYSADQLVRMLKPGDIIADSEGGGHTFVVVGYDDNGIYTAEDGYYMRSIKYSSLTNGKESYRLMFLDRYYANANNRNNLYG